MGAQYLSDLITDAEYGVQPRQRVLEYHADARAAAPA
jgi:hypothetical protein